MINAIILISVYIFASLLDSFLGYYLRNRPHRHGVYPATANNVTMSRHGLDIPKGFEARTGLFGKRWLCASTWSFFEETVFSFLMGGCRRLLMMTNSYFSSLLVTNSLTLSLQILD